MRRVAGIAMLLCLAAAVSVEAQNGPDNDPDGALGYVNNAFHQGQVDSVNLYNGQLTVPVSLGPSYSVGPRLKVQAMLVYGSRVFDYGHPPAQSPDHTYQPLAGDPALGIGWTFTFGSVRKCPNLCFIAADGSRHLFEYVVQGTGGLDYKTTDASPLYLHTLPNNGGYQMWDGDGNRYDMTWQVSGFDDVIDSQQQTGYTRDFGRGRDGWYARVVEDPYGNSFSVDYYDTVIDGITFPCWTYDDSNCTTGNYVTHMLCSPAGKTQSWIPKTVHVPGATIDIHLNSSRQVSSIEFPVYASGGTTTKATWSFTYDTTPVSWECRYTVSSQIEMRRLTTISLPLSLATYGFQYGSTRSGLLIHIDLPTGGDLDYCYGAYTFFHGRISHMEPGCSQQLPDTSEAVLTSTTEFYCGAAAAEPVPEIPGGCQSANANVAQYLDTQIGVVRRSERTASGGTPAITHYTQYAFPWGEQGDKTHTTGGSQTVTVVVSPADNDGHVSAKALLFYSGPKNLASQFYNGDRTGADVQERVFDADPNDGIADMPVCGPRAATEAKYCASKSQRVTTRMYDYDTQTSEIGNRRLSSETVCYGSLLQATGACSTTTSHKVAYTNTSTCPPPSGTSLCVWDGDNGRHYNQEKHTDDSTTQTTVTRGSQTWEQYIYDGLGRLVREINQTGASAYAVRTHGFDAPGHEFFTSEWGNCASAADCLTINPLGTTSSNYDPLGRAQAVTGPSNATYVATSRTDGSILYSDTKEAVSSCVNGPWSGSTCSSGSLVTTTTVKDLFGRVKSVTDPIGGFASYSYDVNDKLRSVSQGAQSRTFTYNAFGYLTQEITPEKGTVKYFDTADVTTRHGSLGNPRILIEGTSPSQVSHAYTYDGAGRLAQDTVGTTQYLLNCYDGNGALGTSLCKDGSTNFNGGSASGGKVTRRVGANPQFTPLYPATTTTEFAEEDFTYAGAGGRVSKKDTLMLGLTGLTIGGASKASEGWVYNTLGLVFSHNHPRVGGVSNQFLETFGYTNGRLSSLTVSGTDYDKTTIPAITITPTFRAAGNLGSYTTQQFGAANSLITIVYQDTSGIPRPRQIQGAVNGTFLFDTGNMTYDAAGNILTMGTDVFSYDTLSRLVSANLGTPQAYTYDGFGNLLSKAATTFCTTTCANNRLTAGNYDTRGNLTGFGGETLTYDAENRQSKDLKSSITWQYLFSGADERLARVPAAAGGLSVPRREIARFIVQGKPFTPYTGSCTDGVPFADVHCADPDFRYIYAISLQPGQASLTGGCGGGNYCPDTAVTRGQSAVLFMKAEHGSTFGPTCLGTYVDAPCSDPTSAYVEVAIAESVLFTCSSGHACSGSPLTELDAAKGMADGNLWPSYKPISGGSLYTLRDNDNHVVTEMADSLPSRDNVYIGNVVVASYLGKQPGVAGAWRFHSSDHLGTVRLTVDGATVGSGFLEQPKYWPYGDLLTPVVAPAQRVAFAAMERDTENNHFYDHARHHDFNLGRFTSPDSVGGDQRSSQSWNRYSYARNNPVRLVDPTGRYVSGCALVEVSCFEQVAAFENARQELLGANDANVRESAASYGELGQLNGVRVDIVDLTTARYLESEGISGASKAERQADGSALVVVKINMLGPGDLERTIAHEGSHVGDLLSFTRTFDPSTKTYDSSRNFTHEQTEVRAFEVGHAASPYKGAPAGTLGFQVLDGALRQNAKYSLNLDRLYFSPEIFPQR